VRYPAMSESNLDQIVKGAPPPGVTAPSVASAPNIAREAREKNVRTPRMQPVAPSDPTSLLPSNPSQIYLNLLILEASLRAQYLTLRARRRQNTFVLTLLGIWTTFFTYLLFLRPREDGKGVGGSVYWVFDMAEKIAWMGGVLTLTLFWGTGQWERGVRWPRRWIAVANRGLRGMNCKIVVLRRPWWREFLGHFAFLIPYGLVFPGAGGEYAYVEHDKNSREQARNPALSHNSSRSGSITEEDIAPGGDHIKVLLLPKHFSPDFRENWELYRSEYWEKENERRAELRKRVRARRREIAKAEGGWLWWVGIKSPWKRKRPAHTSAHVHSFSHSHTHSSSSTPAGSMKEKPKHRRPSILKDRESSTLGRSGSHSRSSSRSSTATPDNETDIRRRSNNLDGASISLDERQRRWSNSTTGSATERVRRRKQPSTSSNTITGPGGSSMSTARTMRLTPATSPSSLTPGDDNRPGTPNSAISTATASTMGAGLRGPPPLDKRASMLSNASYASTGSVGTEGSEDAKDMSDIKEEKGVNMEDIN
jgi:hypothetical protein